MSLSFGSGHYDLRQVSSGDKTVLLMKLTDSALRIIESYLDNASNLRSKPSIQFQGNQGVIQIPVHGDGEVQQFSFQVSNHPPFDCLQQIRTSHSEKVEYLGTVEQKITINANDDSYKTTRKRVELAKQEEQKTSTKEIKQPGSKIGKAYKKTTKGRLLEKSKLKPSSDSRAPTPPMSRLPPGINRSSSPLTLSNKDRSISPPVPGMGRNKTKPTITLSSGPKGGSSPSSNGNAAVAAKPLLQRVAHLLALRPYKYPEIVLRLQKDRQLDRNKLTEALQKVAANRTTQGVGLEYCLMKSQHANLEPDTWPGYTDAERKIVKRKVAEFLGSSDARKRPYSNAHSPPDILMDTQHDDEYSNPTIKKQRVSHFKPRSSERSPSLQPDIFKSHSPGNSKLSYGTAQIPKNRPPGSRKSSLSPPKSKSVLKISPKYQEKKSPLLSSSDENMESNDEELLSCPEEDYLTKYTQISTEEQRDRYKNDFYAEYDEYLNHHQSVSEVAKKFEAFQEKLSQYEKGSEGYMKLSKKVIEEYRKTKRDDVYHREKERWLFLHRKLQHIKELVIAFDQHKLANNRPQNHSQFSMQPVTKVA